VARKERRTPSASRERDERRPHRAARGRFDDEMDEPPPVVAPRLPRRAVGPPSSPRFVCGDNSCRAVRPGCHIEYRTTAQGGSVMGGGSNVEVCN
jgi:hypothetical protein